MARVAVVGGGVIGLTAALALVGDGHEVGVITRERWPETTSAVAGGLWFPYLAEPRARVVGWAAETLRWLLALPP
ncbi:MAG TPA: FAD-dependent oxidoreductase, partial [Myxococcota bacterium]|nr:FAD-dependent oxidoreductase [Myxococcota bacterium]